MKQKIVPIALIAAVVALVLLGGYYFLQYQKTKALLNNPNQNQDAVVSALVNKIGTLIELPTGETPTVATVSDVKKLSGQPFFAKAQNGDKVLIYAKAGKAILFRESANKIIEVSALNVGAPASNPQTTPIATPTTEESDAVSVTIYNGTGTTGLAKSAGQKITSKYSKDTIATGDSSGSDYKNTIVIDLSGKNSKAASDIASLLGGKVTSAVPDGETKPTTEILVIVGADFTGN